MKRLMTALLALALSCAVFAAGGETHLKVNQDTRGSALFAETLPSFMLAQGEFNDIRDLSDFAIQTPARDEEATAVEPGIGVDEGYNLQQMEERSFDPSTYDFSECYHGVNLTDC